MTFPKRMSEKESLLPPPSPASFLSFLESILPSFNSRRVIYLDKKGGWEENPITLRDRICHTLLFETWKKGPAAALADLEKAVLILGEEHAWPLVRKIGQALGREFSSSRVLLSAPLAEPLAETLRPCLHLFETLLWIVERQCLQLNAKAKAPEWNRLSQAVRSDSQKKLVRHDGLLESLFSPAEKRLFLETVSRVEIDCAFFFEPLVRLMADEEKTTAEVEKLLEEASSSPDRAELYAAIIDRLQPPMGIVSELSPALFYPALRLLLDPRVDIESGIPYMASVVLSIFNDPRSAGVLLEALKLYPLGCTKIRENLIFTLGNLREQSAVPAIVRVLEESDENSFLLEQKEEAIWALGKIGFASAAVLPSLVRYVDHPSARLKTYLAWTLGEVGRGQKEKTGGLSADLVIALLRLLKEKNKQVFEEAASALRKIQMPEFLHSLYLYHTGAVNILGLKPAQRGLNELSETVHHLLKTKKRVVLAVNGDSGTGKTYFCQAIAEGFGSIQPSEILYLMRDSKRGQKVFNRLLGLNWLKQHIDPAYYQDYPVAEHEDAPEAFFWEFLEQNSDKRLILLDGCRDRHYFQRVIDTFYRNGELDVEVNFRANFSTRRLNLEERERALESVKLHLAFLEEPALEDTSFYQEGLVILYDFDNSVGSRLSQQETREVFEKSRVDGWGEFIRLGSFDGGTCVVASGKGYFDLKRKKLLCRQVQWPETRASSFSFEEEILPRKLNKDLEAEPNLVMTMCPENLEPDRLRFYAQDQVAGSGKKGKVFVLTMLDNHLFKTSLQSSLTDFCLLGRLFFLRTEDGRWLSLSFEKNEITEFLMPTDQPFLLTAWPPDCLITAGVRGTVSIWNFAEKNIFELSAGLSPAIALAADQKGRIYTWNQEGLFVWDFSRQELIHAVGFEPRLRWIKPYLGGKILAVEDAGSPSSSSRIFVLDFEKNSFLTLCPYFPARITNVSFSADGRILVGLSPQGHQSHNPLRTLAVITPGEDKAVAASLSGHGKETRDCLPLGPRLISCGEELDGTSTIRVWGSAFFVRTELGKLRIMGSDHDK